MLNLPSKEGLSVESEISILYRLEIDNHIPNDVIERRYTKGIINLFKMYLPIIHEAFIFDNSNGIHQFIAHRTYTNELEIFDDDKFKLLKKIYENKG